jgi:hypothetical protein
MVSDEVGPEEPNRDAAIGLDPERRFDLLDLAIESRQSADTDLFIEVGADADPLTMPLERG